MPSLKLTTFGLLIILMSCSSKKTLTIKSKIDDVTISALNSSKENYEVIGKAPLNLKEEKFQKYNNNQYINLRLTRPGFVTENYLINTAGRDKIEIVAKLTELPDWTNPNSMNSSIIANAIMSDIQKINYLIKNAQYDDAIKKIGRLIEKYPSAHILYDLQGSIHLLNGEKGRSIASFEKSLIVNPINQQTKKVLDKLKAGKK